MQPTLNLFGLELQTFGIAFAGSLLGAGWLIARRLRELRRPPDWAWEMIFVALLGGLVGSRGYFLLQNFDQVRHDLVGSLFSGSGLIWYGGLAGGAIAVALWAWRRKLPALTLLDLCAPALALGYAIGRIGCQLSGDGDYGKPSHLPWAMGYPHGTVPTPPGVTVQPTPVYETLAMGALALLLWRLRDRYRAGVLFALYLLLAGAERFLVEFVRRNHPVAAGLTAAQLESIALMLVGAVWLAVAARVGRRARSASQPVAGSGQLSWARTSQR